MSTATESVDLVGDDVVVNLVRAALLAALTGAFAYVSVELPVSVVPFTLQVLGVFLAALYLGPAWGTVSMVLYLLAGLLGLPVFEGGGAGLGALLGLTGGYLFSYPPAAALAGVLVHGTDDLRAPSSVSLPRFVAAMVAAVAVIYTMGVLQLSYVGNLGLGTAVATGAVVFLPAEALKIAAAVGVVRSEAVRPT